MPHKVITPVTTEPVLKAEARLQLKLTTDDGTDNDALLEAEISAAREFAEHYVGKALAAQTLEMALDEFPADGAGIALELPPVASIVSIKYTDTDGVEQTLASSVYYLSLYGEARHVTLKYNQTWPTTQDVADAVRIQYVTGSAACPKAAKTAILFHIEAHSTLSVASAKEIEHLDRARDALLDTVTLYGY